MLDAQRGIDAEDRLLLSERDGRYIVVWNKSDAESAEARAAFERVSLGGVIEVSARTGEGMEALEKAIEAKIGTEGGQEDMLTQERHIGLALQAASSLRMAADAMESGAPLDMATVDLWDAIRALGEITGEDATESLIGEIFSRFCVGK